ncbi:MAG: ribonuclease E/G [Alphaproteobacteria bacterium]|nr:ribonuclease E/G [Alphaproteobacteria bacterium]
MGSKMLIDASQPEETRVVVARGNRLEEFDFESASRTPLKGNIYLAKVTRVEPSLQAAFVDYGGNRHGFLAFAEIHPDYYQIPIADRLALIAEQEAEEAEDDDDDDMEGAADHAPAPDNQPDDHGEHDHDHDDHDHLNEEAHAEDQTPLALVTAPEPELSSAPNAEFEEPAFVEPTEAVEEHADANPADDNAAPPAAPQGGELEVVEGDAESHKVETIGEEDAMEEVPQRSRRQPRRRYKIQEVIKRRQILLVQVVKEERGNKGAALTTYMSLAGRYCVLMPNTAKGGGISRKITDANDRRRLKEVAKDVEVPKGMGVIVRTAGAQRTRPEIKRDFDYLMRLWESVRELTLKSTAPCVVYEEGNIIKRSIRDLYTKDVDEVIVEGEAAYRDAKDFMKMLMPSHAKNVKPYKETRPLFQRYQVENILDGLFSPTVTLPSGGYLVINQTEALVSIDINSGKATREHNIEDTATKTNLEACDEIARQLRLRDLAGLVVIDFIDMEENRNNRAVERRMKDALKNDRARIQVGRISHFGLLEMSRQRLRPGLLEGTFRPCPHCEGRGIVRSVPSCGLGVLRSIEEYLQKGRAENLTVKCARDVAFYLLNEKRDSLLIIEQAYGVSIFIQPADDMKGPLAQIERAPDREHIKRRIAAAASPVQMDSAFEAEDENEEESVEEDFTAESDEAANVESVELNAEQSENGERREGGRKRRRRGRRGGKRDERGEGNGHVTVSENADETEVSSGETEMVDDRPAPDSSEDFDGATAASDSREPSAEGDAHQGRNRERGGRKRGRFGRDRGGRERGERREHNGEQSAPSLEGGSAAPERAPRIEAEVTPTQPVVIIIPEPAPQTEARKWQPPAPTVSAEAAPRKGGWWSKRT